MYLSNLKFSEILIVIAIVKYEKSFIRVFTKN